MTTLEVVSLAFTFFIALLASWAVLGPFFSVDRISKDRLSKMEDNYPGELTLILRKERVFSLLEELELDYRGKKISHSDYERERQRLMEEARENLIELEASNLK